VHSVSNLTIVKYCQQDRFEVRTMHLTEEVMTSRREIGFRVAVPEAYGGLRNGFVFYHDHANIFLVKGSLSTAFGCPHGYGNYADYLIWQ